MHVSKLVLWSWIAWNVNWTAYDNNATTATKPTDEKGQQHRGTVNTPTYLQRNEVPLRRLRRRVLVAIGQQTLVLHPRRHAGLVRFHHTDNQVTRTTETSALIVRPPLSTDWLLWRLSASVHRGWESTACQARNAQRGHGRLLVAATVSSQSHGHVDMFSCSTCENVTHGLSLRTTTSSRNKIKLANASLDSDKDSDRTAVRIMRWSPKPRRVLLSTLNQTFNDLSEILFHISICPLSTCHTCVGTWRI